MGKWKELLYYSSSCCRWLWQSNSNYIKPFENEEYNVRAKFLLCAVNASICRNIEREHATGRIINSSIIYSFREKPEIEGTCHKD